MTWSANKHFWLTDQSESLICLCAVCANAVHNVTYHKIITPYKSVLTTSHSCCPWIRFYFAERLCRPSPSGALVLFLGRQLNDHCLAVSQMQPWCSPHWACLNRCPFSHNTPFRLHLPALYSQPALNRTTTPMTVKLAYTNLVSFSSAFSFRGEGWIWDNKVRCPVTRGWIK